MSMPAPPSATTEPDPPHPYRMKDLCALTDLHRQAIHFYIQQGLLPPGRKTSRNMAYYSDVHLERLRLIKRLQHERFLPLRAIKAILNDQHGTFSKRQRSFLYGVKAYIQTDVAAKDEAATRRVAEVLRSTGVTLADFARLKELELLFSQHVDGHEVIASSDVWLLESWAEVRRLRDAHGFPFEVDDIQLVDETVAKLFTQEARLMASRIDGFTPEQAAQVVDQILPLVERFIVGLHRAKVRNFLASL